jgi:hypothetical protein
MRPTSRLREDGVALLRFLYRAKFEKGVARGGSRRESSRLVPVVKLAYRRLVTLRVYRRRRVAR